MCIGIKANVCILKGIYSRNNVFFKADAEKPYE